MKIKVFNIRLDDENLEEDQEKINSFLENVIFKKSSTNIISEKTNYWSILIHYEEKEENYIDSQENKKNIFDEETLTDKEKEIVAYFKQWRWDKSKEENIPAYMILTNKTIISIAKTKPETIDDLDKVTGIGENKKRQYGDSIIALINTV
ncbi:MAG: HRDC domain-containing protein [Myroides sp.]